MSPIALAWDNLTVIANTNNSASAEFVDEFKVNWQKLGGANLPINLVDLEQLNAINISNNSLVIAVGVQALVSASKLDIKIPVMGVLIPKLSYDKILKDSGRSVGNLSAIFIDQSISRQMAFLKTVLPNTKTVGVLLGNTSSVLRDDIYKSANKAGIDVHIDVVTQPDELTRKLQHTLAASDAILAIADPEIYNKDTAATFLLTTYRQQRPVIGFSQAYVKAGALAGIFSTPKLLAKQAVEQVLLLKDKSILPAPLNPQYFSVEVNRQVARSLSIEILDGLSITEQTLKFERAMP